MTRSAIYRPLKTLEIGLGFLILLAFWLSYVCDADALTATPRPKPEAPKDLANDMVQQAQATLPRHRAKDLVAKEAFGKSAIPASLAARSIGSYARGCLAGGQALAIDGETWQVMRLSRNRNWGHPDLIRYLEDLAKSAPSLGWRGLMVGDLAQPRGGPMLTGHRSHQIGLDADIWLREMPARRLSRAEREEISAISMLDASGFKVDPRKWTDDHAKLIRKAASDQRVARIFVHPAIKRALCDFETGNRDWLRTVRPWYGHHYHFHVRLSCPASSKGCENQSRPPAGDGCGKELAWWFTDEPYAESDTPRKPRPPAKVASLPDACTDVLLAR